MPLNVIIPSRPSSSARSLQVSAIALELCVAERDVLHYPPNVRRVQSSRGETPVLREHHVFSGPEHNTAATMVPTSPKRTVLQPAQRKIQERDEHRVS